MRSSQSKLGARIIIAAAGLLSVAAVAMAANPNDFTVKSGEKQFRLADAKGNFVALHFLLETDCPYCMQHVREYAEKAPTIAGFEHVFLKPDDDAAIAAWTKAYTATGGPAVTIFRDEGAALADKFGVPGGYKLHGRTVHYPALIVLGPDGKEQFRHVSKSNADRLPFAEFATKISEQSRSAAVGSYNVEAGKPAVGGYDVTAYLDGGRAEKGMPEITSQYQGLTYCFATPQARAKFAADPMKYLPAYGGWCATAMAEGRKVEIDPTNFEAKDGRTFLFYRGWLGDAQKDWRKDESNLRRRADDQWRKIAPGDVAVSKGGR